MSASGTPRDTSDQRPLIAHLLTLGNLGENAPVAISEALTSLDRSQLEGLAQELFQVLKESEPEVQSLRRQRQQRYPGPTRSRSEEQLPTGGHMRQGQGPVRLRSGQPIPKDDGEGEFEPVSNIHDRLYNSGRQQQLTRQKNSVPAQSARVRRAKEDGVANEAPQQAFPA
mmetsp:Transcript_23744/g.54838  ORF Transcript_23744/g.54838 Transcript_23744/m.54838 type:complete len:170 (+) Transcript_23744:54-563(+)